MTLLEFVNKHIGKKVDFDGYYGPQCVDLYRQYCQDVWEIPHTGSVEGAKDLVEKYYILSSLRMRACCLCSSRTDSRRTAQSSHGAQRIT